MVGETVEEITIVPILYSNEALTKPFGSDSKLLPACHCNTVMSFSWKSVAGDNKSVAMRSMEHCYSNTLW